MNEWIKRLEGFTEGLFQEYFHNGRSTALALSLEETDDLDNVKADLERICSDMNKLLEKVGTWE